MLDDVSVTLTFSELKQLISLNPGDKMTLKNNLTIVLFEKFKRISHLVISDNVLDIQSSIVFTIDGNKDVKYAYSLPISLRETTKKYTIVPDLSSVKNSKTAKFYKAVLRKKEFYYYEH